MREFEFKRAHDMSMGHSPDMQPETQQVMQPEMQPTWENHPFIMAGKINPEGVRPVRNMVLIPEIPSASSSSSSESITPDELEAGHLQERERLIKDRFIVIGVCGRNKLGKGTFMMAKTRVFRQDTHLHDVAKKEGFDIDIVAVPYAHAPEAAKSPKIRLIDPALTPAEYTLEDSRSAAKLQWHMIDKHALPKGARTKEEVTAEFKKQNKAVVILVEASTPLVFPKALTDPSESEPYAPPSKHRRNKRFWGKHAIQYCY